MSDLSNNAFIQPDRRGVRSFSIQALGTRCRLQFRCDDAATAMKLVGTAAAWLGAFERKCSHINNAASQNWVDLDPEIEQLLKAADTANRLSEGLLNPAALPLTRLCETRKAQGVTPSNDEVQKALELSDWKAIRREPGKIFLPRTGMGLDLTILSRKYAVDVLIRLLRQHGIQDALMQVGTDLFALGGEGESAFWSIGAEQGLPTSGDVTPLRLSNQALSFVSLADSRVDPRTGMPPQHDLRSVIVVAANSLTAGVHATSMMILGPKEGLRFAESTGMVDACLMSPAGVVATTRGFKRFVEPAIGPQPAVVVQTQPKVVQRWLARDLIRLWPWLLPAVLLLITFGPAGLQHSSAEPGAAAAALGMVWMTFYITRRLWGHYRAHAAATMLMFTLGLFAIGWLPMPDMTLCFLNLAAIAALVHQRSWSFFALLGLGFLIKGPIAALVPATAALGWWLGGARREGRAWLPGAAIALIASLAGLFWQTVPAQTNLLGNFEGSWWRFLPMLFLGLMPWSFCTPRVVRQGWHRLRTGTLQARHGLLAGWLLPSVALTPGGLSAGALLLVPALVIAFCPPLADARRLWTIGAAALTLWMASGWVLNAPHGAQHTPSMTQNTVQARTVREVMPPPESSALTALNRSQPISQASAHAFQR